jgi:hypothetical protein
MIYIYITNFLSDLTLVLITFKLFGYWQDIKWKTGKLKYIVEMQQKIEKEKFGSIKFEVK